jgi:hypothetical protein
MIQRDASARRSGEPILLRGRGASGAAAFCRQALGAPFLWGIGGAALSGLSRREGRPLSYSLRSPSADAVAGGGGTWSCQEGPLFLH